jgi:SRSO17 transposase
MHAPADIPRSELVCTSGMRWPTETIFKESKGEARFDHYETCSWLGWHHHIVLFLLAHRFLVRLTVLLKEHAPALTI